MICTLGTLEKSLTASEKTIAALMLHTYSVLNKEFKLVESKAKRTQDYQNLLDEYCKDKHGAADGVDRNSMTIRLNAGGKVHIIKRSTMLLQGGTSVTTPLRSSRGVGWPALQ